MQLRRLLYFGYYLKKTNWSEWLRFLQYTKRKYNTNYIRLVWDNFWSIFRYNISPLEYFQFNFFSQNEAERSSWAGTGFMYEFHRKMNPPKSRNILSDKRIFAEKYADFLQHKSLPISQNPEHQAALEKLLDGDTKSLVLKAADANCGRSIAFVPSSNFEHVEALISYAASNNYQLVEEKIIQHPNLQKLAPNAVNTARIFTQLRGDEVIILGCRLRISIHTSVDNLAAGNAAAPIDENSGIITGPAVFSDITKAAITHHPMSGVEILGFQIPHWDAAIALVKKAAKLHPENKSIGWDIAITTTGPDLIEGNHDWCKLLWQLPVQKGLKPLILPYMSE